MGKRPKRKSFQGALMKRQKDNYAELLALYAEGPAMLEAALAGLGETGLDLAKAAGEWTIRQIVHHIADGDDIWIPCIKGAIGNSDGLFSLRWYADKPQIEWVELWKYSGRSIQPSMDLLCANRRHVLQLLEQIPDAGNKTIWFKRRNKRKIKIRIVDVLEIQAGHVVEHVEEIKLIRQIHAI
jgi:hypothetical protein